MGRYRERHFEPGIETRWQFRPDLEAHLGYRYDQGDKINRVAEDDRELNWLLAEVVYGR